MKSLQLNDSWDISLDGGGNLAQVSEKLAVAQDVATAVRLFQGEAVYLSERGVPHYTDNLGVKLSQAMIRSDITDIALTVPNVTAVSIENEQLSGRTYTADIRITDSLSSADPAPIYIKYSVDDFYSLTDVYSHSNIYKPVTEITI